MKCELVCPLEKRNPEYDEQEHHECLRTGKPYGIKRDVWQPVGTVIDNPDAWKLVKIGAAKPFDSECKIAAGNLSDDELSLRFLQYQKIDRGMTTGRKNLDGTGEVSKRIPAGMELGTAGIDLSNKEDDDE